MTDVERVAFSIREAAEAVGLSESTVRKAYREGQITAHFPTNNPTILRDDLVAWIKRAPTERQAS